jgi:imidazolonepropionase
VTRRGALKARAPAAAPGAPFGFAAGRLVTCDPARGGALGAVEDGAVVIDAGRLAYVGPRAGAPADVALEELGDLVVTPGLVDAHTHACWVGSRHDEYVARMRGDDYLAIARAGGGIRSTQRAVSGATDDALCGALVARLRRMASLGVTTVEVKSGYGLEPSQEKKQLAAIARAAAERGVPDVVPTLLALHALPPGATDRDAFAASVAGQLVPAIAREKLARFVDAYVDADAFTVQQARVVGEAARAAGLGVRLHVGQFADVGGAELAGALGCASADHLEHVSPSGIEALARAGVAAVLLPVASFSLGQPPPPIGALRAAGVRLVIGSDANPGTSPTESLPLAMALAVRIYGLTPEEALLGATVHAAAALRLHDRGLLRAGLRADLVVWDLPHEHAIVQPWGGPRTRAVLVEGRPIP